MSTHTNNPRYVVVQDPDRPDGFAILDTSTSTLLGGAFAGHDEAGKLAREYSASVVDPVDPVDIGHVSPPSRVYETTTHDDLIARVNLAASILDGHEESSEWDAETIEHVVAALGWSFGRRFAKPGVPLLTMPELNAELTGDERRAAVRSVESAVTGRFAWGSGTNRAIWTAWIMLDEGDVSARVDVYRNASSVLTGRWDFDTCELTISGGRDEEEATALLALSRILRDQVDSLAYAARLTGEAVPVVVDDARFVVTEETTTDFYIHDRHADVCDGPYADKEHAVEEAATRNAQHDDSCGGPPDPRDALIDELDTLGFPSLASMIRDGELTSAGEALAQLAKDRTCADDDDSSAYDKAAALVRRLLVNVVLPYREPCPVTCRQCTNEAADVVAAPVVVTGRMFVSKFGDADPASPWMANPAADVLICDDCDSVPCTCGTSVDDPAARVDVTVTAKGRAALVAPSYVDGLGRTWTREEIMTEAREMADGMVTLDADDVHVDDDATIRIAAGDPVDGRGNAFVAAWLRVDLDNLADTDEPDTDDDAVDALLDEAYSVRPTCKEPGCGKPLDKDGSCTDRDCDGYACHQDPDVCEQCDGKACERAGWLDEARLKTNPMAYVVTTLRACKLDGDGLWFADTVACVQLHGEMHVRITHDEEIPAGKGRLDGPFYLCTYERKLDGSDPDHLRDGLTVDEVLVYVLTALLCDLDPDDVEWDVAHLSATDAATRAKLTTTDILALALRMGATVRS